MTATQTAPTANSFLMGGGVTSAKFPTIGTTVSGTICQEPEVQQQRDFQTNELKFWPDGGPMQQLKIVVQTAEADNADDNGQRAIYVKGQMRQAVADAVRKSGADGLQIGGTLTVTYAGDGEAKPRMSAPKNYTATYKAPAAGADFLGTPQPDEQPAQPAAPAVAPDNSAPKFSPEQIAAMKAAGVDLAAMGVATG